MNLVPGKKIGFEINLGAGNCGLAAAPWGARSWSEACLGEQPGQGGTVGRAHMRVFCSHVMKHNRSETI